VSKPSIWMLASILVLAAADAIPGQVPNVQIFFEGNPATKVFHTTESDCYPPGTFQNLYVVMNNWNMWVQAVEFSVDYPPALFWAADEAPINTLVIGSSPSDFPNGYGTGGIAIAWQFPQNAYEPLLAITAKTIWTGSCWCPDGPSPLRVRGYAYNNAGNGGNVDPVAVRWPDFAELPGIGMMSLVCSNPPATAVTTWGRIKALYR
jgi:hypothetical protein